MSRTSRWSLFFEWAWFRFQRFLILLLGIGAYGSEPPAALITSTQEVWKKRLGREVPKEEALQIIHSVKNFLSLLKEIRHNGK